MPDQEHEGRTAAEIEAARKLFAGPCEFIAGAGAGSAAATAGLALPPPIGVPWRRMIVYCWAIDRMLDHAQ